MNPIEFLQSYGFRITSDPNEYRESYPDGKRNPWGLRNYHENGRNMDQYCNGYHNAYDMSDVDGAAIPSIADGVVSNGTRNNGTFGGQVLIVYEQLGIQVIYGHVKTPLSVKVGQEVKQGDTIAYQGSTNNQGVSMSSHLHIQFQNIESLNEWEFTCSGRDVKDINVNQKGNDIVANYKIVNMFVPSSKYRIKAPYAMSPTTLTVHNTANTASARNEVAYMRGNNSQTSYHVAIDHIEAVQALPFNRNGWAAGDGLNGQGNRRSIHVEICYSMDNGYSGRYSNRHAQAEKNAALYIAHVLDQYGWGVSRLRQHYDWSRKDCPHKMRAWNNWRAFKNMVQGYLNDIKKGNSPGTSKPTSSAPSTSKPSTPKASGSTYTVRKGDALWGIANANGVTVANLKSWNNLKSNIINIGQKLNVKKSSNSGSSNKTGGAGNIKYSGDWRFNSNTQVYWVPVKNKYTLAYDTYAYDKVPKIIRANRLSKIKAGTTIDVVELCRYVEPSGKSFVWAVYRTGKGRLRYLPIKEWNKQPGRITNSGLWGYFS